MPYTMPADVYNQEIATAYAQASLVENLAALSLLMGTTGASPIVLNPTGLVNSAGNYVNNPKFNVISSSLVGKRDVANGGNAATIRSMSMRNEFGVRSCLTTGPIGLSDDLFRRNAMTPELFNAEIGRQVGFFYALKLRQTIIAALKGALSAMTSTLHTKSVYAASVTKANMTTALLLQAKYVLGDAAERFNMGGGLIFRSEAALDLGVYQTTQGVQGISDVMARTGQPQTTGLPFAMADDSNLKATNGGSWVKYYTLGLGPGCIELDIESFQLGELWKDPTKISTQWIVRADGDILIGVPGFGWNKTNGGLNPDTAEYATAANWDPLYNDHREVLAFLIEHNSSAA